MPTVTLSRKSFDQLVGKKLDDKTIEDRMSYLGTAVEEVNDKEIVVEVFPNRPDLLSEQGMARAFASFIGLKTGLREYTVKKSGVQVIVDPSVSMRPYTACAIVKNLRFDDERIREVMQIQEKLATTHGRNRKKSAYGLYPLKHIHFPITYIAKDPSKVKFRPLGFDKAIIASKVEELHPKGKEYASVAKGWKKYPFFIDSKDNVLCMLPYTNSDDTGKIDETTTEVFIECTGVDLQNVQIALNIFTTMLADMGGVIHSIDIVYPDKTITTPNLTPKQMPLDATYVNKYLGLTLTKKECLALLAKMGYGQDGDKVLVPAYRADILHQIDLVEDIAIAYGFENFKPHIRETMTIGQQSRLEGFKQKLALVLVGLGYLETKTYHIVNKEKETTAMGTKLDVLELANSVSEEHHALRAWLIPSLIRILSENTRYEYPQYLFELGRVFVRDATTETGTREDEVLGMVLCSKDADLTKARQLVDYIFGLLAVSHEVQQTKHPSYITGRCAQIVVGKAIVGTFGEAHPQILEENKIEMPLAAVEINISALYQLIKQ